MKSIYPFILILLGFINHVLAQDLIPREKLFDTSNRKEIFQISNDGKWVFYIKDIYNYKPTLYYINVNEPSKELSYTFEGAVEGYNILKDFVIVRTASPEGQKFVRFNLETAQANELDLPVINRARVYGKKDNLVAAILTGEGIEPGLYKIDVTDGKYELVRKGEGFISYKFDANLNPIAGEKPNQHAGKSFFYLKDNNWVQFREYHWDVGMTVRGVQNILTVSADGRYVYFTDNKQSDITNLIELDAQTGNEKVIFDQAISDIMPVGYLLGDDRRLLSVISHYGKSRHYPLSDLVKQDFDFLLDKIKELHIQDWSEDKSYWLVEEMNGGANEYFLYDRPNQKLIFLFNDHPFLSDYKKNLRYTYEITSFDGTNLPINLYIREDLDQDNNGVPESPLPAVIYVHGGPWIGWQNNNWLITRNLQLLANRGYAVVYAEFRGAATLGKAFADKAAFEWGEGMTNDKLDIADWLGTKKIARKDRLGIFGWSYGGYAAMAGLAYSDKYTCGISMYGISDLNRFLRTEYANYPVWRNMVADIKTDDGVALAKKHSPLYNVADIDEPLLLTTGAKDRRIATNQSQLMADSLDAKGVNVGYLLYPDEGHDYRQPQSWSSFWGYAETFLNQYLGGDFEPYVTSETVNYEMIYEPNFHELHGIWEAIGDMQFSIIKQDTRYKAVVVSPGELSSILNVGDELFTVRKKAHNKYAGDFYRIYEGGTKKSEKCTMQLNGETLLSSYKVSYKKVKG